MKEAGEWITEKCQDIIEQRAKDGELTMEHLLEEVKDEIAEQAYDAYIDYQADIGDQMYEAERDRRMEENAQ